MNATTTPMTNGKSAETTNPMALVREISLAQLDESPTQPRKTFLGVEDLAKGVAEHGILQPILVRPKGKRFEIVFGARRYRAAKIAKLGSIPATVRELDDAKALELQIVENSQREDVHPLEEAEGYQTLHEKHGYTVEEIAAKTGKSTATIYARLKFTSLIPEARKAFFDGVLTAATALVVARIPHPDLQKKALAELTKKDWSNQVPSAREATRIVRDRFMLRLVDAPFDRNDATLVAAAGACGDCPKRTANQTELFADLESKDDLCTDPKCFASKRDAAAAKKIEEAKAKGVEVLPEKTAKKLFKHGHMNYDSGFVDLNAKRFDPATGKDTTPRKELGKAEVKVVLAKDDDGNLHELVTAKDFAKATKKPAPKPSKAELRQKAEAEAAKKRTEREKVREVAVLTKLVASAERRAPNDAFWRVLAEAIVGEFDVLMPQVLKRRELTEDIDVSKLTAAQARGLIVEVLCVGAPGAKDAFGKFYGDNKPAKAKPAAKAKAKSKKAGGKKAR